MPFFVNPKTKKRKFQAKDQKSLGKKKGLKNQKALSEEVESDSDVDSNEATETRGKFYSSDEDEEETPQQKRLRLAKEYLSQLENEEAENIEDEDAVKQAVSSRLQHDISEQAGKLTKEVADTCSCPRPQDLRVFRGHSLPVTAVVITPDDKFVFTASKDCNICKWDVQSGLKVKTIKGGRKGTEDVHIGHTDHILCLAISSDGNFLAAGDMNNMVKLWNPHDCSFIHKFRGHRGPVTGVSFRKGTHTLFSCSTDKAVKVWSVDELAYVETLYGHNSPITCIDSLNRDRAITSGGSDRSIHIWKIPEDSQLLFYGHEGSIECVALINEGNFFSGSEDSSLCLWSVLKKKPLVTRQHAHGTPAGQNSEDWISAVAALQYSDLVASGSKDGLVRLWKCGPNFKSLSPLFEVPVNGFVNSLSFSSNGDFLVVGVGQEHRLGRWWRLKDAKNGWVIIPLKGLDQSSDDSGASESSEEGSDDDSGNSD
ncbi:U3 small nucleolar RNA-interacting protein 2 isoform X2 [Aplysia californica]|uniref:U3 small nucleolar RNA-interacting protein 2 isoform X2 n=1 Tax=Aplysia californica TaxID=6500 RepID=A0ABM0JI54_APLCA|nr:U3 small nucleolar RNA-interacting protein 2 isoform X2 [Aplysia californica]